MQTDATQFVQWFRESSPYIHAFRGRMFVVYVSGEAVQDDSFAGFIHDIALLNNLGVRVVLIHGARPQIDRRCRQSGIKRQLVKGLRITDARSLSCFKEAIGAIKLDIEALLSTGLPSSPMSGAKIRVVTGNFVVGKPVGVKNGIDYQHTGSVRRIDVQAIEEALHDRAIVLLSPVGFSASGEIFNLCAEELAANVAVQMQADKLVLLTEETGPCDAAGKLIRQMTVHQASDFLEAKNKLPKRLRETLQKALQACQHGVRRAHLIDRHIDGGMLLELFSRDGIGSLVTDDIYEGLRQATIDDVAGIIELISPLEKSGTLVKRSREYLEADIDHFIVIERDGMVIGCAAFYTHSDCGIAELACLAVHPDYQNQGRGDTLLAYIDDIARQQQLQKLVVLTTEATHWFREHNFKLGKIADLPVKKQALYNYQRNSKIYLKKLN